MRLAAQFRSHGGSRVKVCVVDDHPLALKGIETVLERHGHTIVAARDIPEAAEVLRTHSDIDALLLDYVLPSGAGTSLFDDPTLPVPPRIAILSAMTDPDDILVALQESLAKAFIFKHTDLDDLVPALELLGTLDEKFVDGAIWDTQHKRFIAAGEVFPEGSVLSPRERQVLSFIRKGLSDKQIAEALNRSIHTIRVQVRSLKRKRKLSRRAEGAH